MPKTQDEAKKLTAEEKQQQREAKARAQRAALPDFFTRFRVTWTFINRLCASVPADPELIRKWLAAREPRVKPAGALSIEQINEEVLASIERGEGEPDQDYAMLVFQRDNGCLVQRYGTVKAHVKDCSRVISRLYTGQIEGEKSFSGRVIDGFNLDPRETLLPILRLDGTPVREADGAFDKPVRFFVRGRGQQSALKRFEDIEPPSQIVFTAMVLGRSVSETDLHHVFMYGGIHGYAGERGDGEGRYTYEIERLDSGHESSADQDVRGSHAKV